MITKRIQDMALQFCIGYRYALEQNADYIFQTDSDGQTLPEEFYGFWELEINILLLLDIEIIEKTDSPCVCYQVR